MVGMPGNALVNTKSMVDSSNAMHFPEKQDVLPLGKICLYKNASRKNFLLQRSKLEEITCLQGKNGPM